MIVFWNNIVSLLKQLRNTIMTKQTIRYDKYMYLFPPRPIQTTHHTEIKKYDNKLFIAQPKYNGTCCNVFILLFISIGTRYETVSLVEKVFNNISNCKIRLLFQTLLF